MVRGDVGRGVRLRFARPTLIGGFSDLPLAFGYHLTKDFYWVTVHGSPKTRRIL